MRRFAAWFWQELVALVRRFAWKWLVALAAGAALAIQWLVGWASAISAARSAAAVAVAVLGRLVWWTWPVLLGVLALWQGPRVARRLRQGQVVWRFAWWRLLVVVAAGAALAIQWLVGWDSAIPAVRSAATAVGAVLGRGIRWTWPLLLAVVVLWQGPRVGRRLRQATTAIWKDTAAMVGKAAERGLLVPLALGVLLLGGLIVASVFVLPRVVEPEAGPELRNSVRTTLLQASGGLVLVLGTIATWRQLHVNREGQITDRYTRAVEQLGAADSHGEEKVDVQLGGISALERIAHDSPHDRRTIVEVLTAFVRHRAKSPGSGQEHERLAESLQRRLPAVQAAMRVLGRMRYPADVRPDLANVHLVGADLSGATLIGDFRKATLKGADLSGATLTGDFRKATLTQAYLQDATLTGDFREATLGTEFWNATLTGDFRKATLAGDFRHVTLTEARLHDADLTGAYSLKRATLSGARANWDTQWPEGFDPQVAGVIIEKK